MTGVDGLLTLLKRIVLSSWQAQLCLALLLGSSQLMAQVLEVDSCDPPKTPLQPWLSFWHDPDRTAGLEDFLSVPPDDLQPITFRQLNPVPATGALWLKFQLHNRADTECRLAIFPGTSRVRDIQLHRQSDEGWEVEVAGANYPLTEWNAPVRIPAFWIQLAADESKTLILRMNVAPAQSVQPMLLSHAQLISLRMSESLVDGVVFGIVGLLVLFSLFMSYAYRLGLLVTHALSVLCYIIYVGLAVGYGFVHFWPDAPLLDLRITFVFGTLTRLITFAYLRRLLLVAELPVIYGGMITLCQISIALLGIAWLMFPEQGSLLISGWLGGVVRTMSAVAIVAIVYAGFRRGLAYNWFSYLFPALSLVQIISQHPLYVIFTTFSPYDYSWFSVTTLLSALLLSYTLISQITLSRQREQQALADIDQLKQTERERLELQVKRRTQQLQGALSAQNMLLARISHDLRSPMQSILNVARQLRTDPGQAAKYAASIDRNASYQLELIDELLEFSSNELHQMELLLSPGYLFGFLQEMEELGRFHAERYGNQFTAHIAADLPMLVNADFRRLQQILINLFANAGKFTQHGQIELRVSHRPAVQQDQIILRLQVADSGIGIPEQDRAHLLQPFTRGSNVEGKEGVGLGLYIVNQMLVRMGSQLIVGSSHLGGAQFCFEVQLKIASEQEVDQVFTDTHQLANDSSQARILVVDDTPVSRETLYELLCGYGYDVTACASAEQALSALAAFPVDLVITDQSMPDKSGWDLLAAIRQRWPQLPVVLYSGAPPTRPAGYPAGQDFSAALLKPAGSGQILSTIELLIREVVSDAVKPSSGQLHRSSVG